MENYLISYIEDNIIKLDIFNSIDYVTVTNIRNYIDDYSNENNLKISLVIYYDSQNINFNVVKNISYLTINNDKRIDKIKNMLNLIVLEIDFCYYLNDICIFKNLKQLYLNTFVHNKNNIYNMYGFHLLQYLEYLKLQKLFYVKSNIKNQISKLNKYCKYTNIQKIVCKKQCWWIIKPFVEIIKNNVKLYSFINVEFT